MSLGPFVRHKQVYKLAFPGFTLGAHIRLLTERESTAQGLDVSRMNLELLAADPMEGDARVQHDAVATVSPDWDGLTGTVQIKARPESRLTAVIAGIGKKYYGTFTESATSAANDLADAFTRKRFVPNGQLTETGGPAGSWQSETVSLKFLANRERGDEYSDLGSVYGEAVAPTDTLMLGDILTSSVHGVWQVRGLANEGDYQKARLER